MGDPGPTVEGTEGGSKVICESGWTNDRCTFPLHHEGPHSNEVPEAWDDRCAACGEWFGGIPTEKAEVVNTTTGARGVVHVECYLADTCCYALA